MNAQQLLTMAPEAGYRAALYCVPLTKAMIEFDITPARQASFLAQCLHESDKLRSVEESLNYSDDGLANTWPNRYGLGDGKGDGKGGYLRNAKGRILPNPLARALHRQPVRIANNVYANRGGNGPESSGDGWKHRGAGLIQLTFFDNHLRCAAYFKIPVEQIGDWLRTPEGACRSAAWFWQTNGCNALADAGDQVRVSKKVNLGNADSPRTPNGLAARLALFDTIKGILA